MVAGLSFGWVDIWLIKHAQRTVGARQFFKGMLARAGRLGIS